MQDMLFAEAFSYLAAVALRGCNSDEDKQLIAEDAYDIDQKLRAAGFNNNADGFKKIISLLVK